MMNKGLRLNMPATYQIRVQGHLDKSWSDRLAGMTISTTRVDDAPVSILTNRLRDQAALLGVLNTLYDLHLPILSVEYLD